MTWAKGHQAAHQRHGGGLSVMRPDAQVGDAELYLGDCLRIPPGIGPP